MKWSEWLRGFSTLKFTGQRPAGDRRTGRRASCKPQLEALESREVMSVVGSSGALAGSTHLLTGAGAPPPPTAAGLALINSLPDVRVRSEALADYQRDGAITRNDLLDIFSYGTIGYTDLPNTAVASLQTLVTNGPTVGMPDYVQALGTKVLAGSPPLGLSPVQALKQNVDNFFLGLKHPDAYGEVYLRSNEPLWHGAPRPADVYQPLTGVAPDNWLRTGLEEVVSRNPNDIQRLFIDNGDGTYTVHLYHGSTPDYLTVDNYVPDFSTYHPVDTGVLWPQLLWKAYVQENATGFLGAPQPGGSSYAALDEPRGGGNPAWAFSALTGLKGSGIASPVSPDAIAAAFTQGRFVALRTSPGADPLLYPECLNGCNGYQPFPRWYALVNYVPDDAWGGRFTVTEGLTSVGGVTVDPLGVRYLEVAGSVLAANFDAWVDSAPGAVPVSHTTSGGPQGVAVAGFVHSATQPVVVAQHPTQPGLLPNVVTATPAPAGLQADALILNALSAGKKQAAVTSLASSAAL